MVTPEQRQRRNEAQRRFQARQKERGIKRVLSEAEKEQQRKNVAARRARAKAAGEALPSDTWARDNAEKHLARTRRWRSENPDRAAELSRVDQARRRSTPWGIINNRMWPIIHLGVRRGTGERSKYCAILGYTWGDLRGHLEALFQPGMTWDNWGDVWELDHVHPLSSFHYETIDDPLFRECWSLSNLRPLGRVENASKGAKSKKENL